MFQDGAVGWIAVIGAIGRELVDFADDPVKQRLHLRGIVGILLGQTMGDDLAAVGIQSQMKLAPGPA